MPANAPSIDRISFKKRAQGLEAEQQEDQVDYADEVCEIHIACSLSETGGSTAGLIPMPGTRAAEAAMRPEIGKARVPMRVRFARATSKGDLAVTDETPTHRS